MTSAKVTVRYLPLLLAAALTSSVVLAAPDAPSLRTAPDTPPLRAAPDTPPLRAAPDTPPLRAGGEAHPIIGTWKWTRKFNNCTETYVYGSDGSLSVTSGAERSDNTFTVSRAPVARGFFEVRMRVTKDHRGTDCAQVDEDDTGKEVISFILFEPTQGMFISCSEPRLQACFGPLVRQPN